MAPERDFYWQQSLVLLLATIDSHLKINGGSVCESNAPTPG